MFTLEETDTDTDKNSLHRFVWKCNTTHCLTETETDANFHWVLHKCYCDLFPVRSRCRAVSGMNHRNNRSKSVRVCGFKCPCPRVFTIFTTHCISLYSVTRIIPGCLKISICFILVKSTMTSLLQQAHLNGYLNLERDLLCCTVTPNSNRPQCLVERDM